jgi:hypothetical protein
MKLKEMMERRTAGEWLVHGDKHTLIHADDGRQMLAETLHGWDYRPKCKISLEEAQANAAYIAHCCNNFPAVVEAMGYIVSCAPDDDLADTEDGTVIQIQVTAKGWRQFVEALAAAEDFHIETEPLSAEEAAQSIVKHFGKSLAVLAD